MGHTAATAIAGLVAFAVAACGGGGATDPKKAEPQLVVPRAGQCIAAEVPDGNDVAPDTETVVPCSKPHIYEIIAVIDIPQKFLSGTTKAQKLAQQKELAGNADKPTKLRRQISTEVYSKCEEPFRESSGLADLTVKGKSARAVDLSLPRSGASQWYTVTSPALWIAGKAKAVCSIRFAELSRGDERATPTPVTSTSSKQVIASYLTKDFPVASRACTDSSKDNAGVACTKAHDQEPLWIMDVKAVYGKGFLSGADLPKVSQEQFTKVTAACADPYEQAGGKLDETRQISFRYFKDRSTTEKSLPIICTFSTKVQNETRSSGFGAF